MATAKKVYEPFQEVAQKFSQSGRFLVTVQRARWKEKRLETPLETRQIQLLRFIWMRAIGLSDSTGFNANELRPLFIKGYLTWTGGRLKVTRRGSALVHS
jgi:hypothetical protein